MAKRYIYRTWKDDGVVRRQYVGKAGSVEAQRYLRERERRRHTLDQLRMLSMLDDLLDETAADLSELELQAMQERGYTRTKDRRWKAGA